MKIFFYSKLINLPMLLTKKFRTIDIEMQHEQDLEGILQKENSRVMHSVIIEDASFDNLDIIKLLYEVRQDKAKNFMRFVLLTSDENLCNARYYAEIGFDRVFSLNRPLDEIFEQLCIYYETDFYLLEKRKYLRIKPGKNDRAVIQFSEYPEKSGHEYRIKDISFGGVSVCFNGDVNLDSRQAEEFQNVQIVLNGSHFNADLKLVKQSDSVAGFRIHKFKDSGRSQLSEYIYSKYSSLQLV